MCQHVLYLHACRCPLTHLLLLPFIECATVCLALNNVCVAWVVTAGVYREPCTQLAIRMKARSMNKPELS